MFNLSAVLSNPANFAKIKPTQKVGPIIAKMMAKVKCGSQWASWASFGYNLSGELLA
jgi:hypothetical protein